jgi:CofH subfamily radical SAM domain protein
VSELSEVCLQGGIDPHYAYKDYLELVRVIRKNFPRIHIHAFSPQEVHHLTEISENSLEQVLLDLKQAGVNSMPGTAAEILVDAVRQKICPQKINTQRWLDIVKHAHQLGLRTSATILFGHIETPAQIATHFQKIRTLQEQTGGFTEFVLLPFIPYHTRLGKNQGMISLEKIKQLVILSRLFFDQTIPHIQMSWPKVGLDFALQMLACGANDVGGTLHEESIARLAGSTQGEFLSRAQLIEGIRSQGFAPWERDTVYQKIPAHALA